MNWSWAPQTRGKCVAGRGKSFCKPASETDLDLHWGCRQDRRMDGFHRFLDMLEEEDRLWAQHQGYDVPKCPSPMGVPARLPAMCVEAGRLRREEMAGWGKGRTMKSGRKLP